MSIFGQLARAAPGGIAAVYRGQAAGEAERAERERREKAEREAAELRALQMAVQTAALSDAGIHQGTAPTPAPRLGAAGSTPLAGMMGPGAAVDAAVGAVDQRRYQSLGDTGYYRDTFETPEAKQRKQAHEQGKVAAANHRTAYDTTAGRFGEKAVGSYTPEFDYQDVYLRLLQEEGDAAAERTRESGLNHRASLARRGSGGPGGSAGGGAATASEKDKARQGAAIMSGGYFENEHARREFGAAVGRLTRNGMDPALAAYYAKQEVDARAEESYRGAAGAIRGLDTETAVAKLKEAGYTEGEIGTILNLARTEHPEPEDDWGF